MSTDENPNNQTEKALSTLEALPVDILEKIFFYSLNVNLPRASPYLATILSNERVYRLLILLAFWDNDYQYDKPYNASKDGHVFGGDPARYGDLGQSTWRENKSFDIPWILRPLGRDYVPLTSNERRRLQSRILLCRWCTNDRIRRQFPDLARLIISRWCINAGYIFEDENEYGELEKLLSSGDEGELYECLVVRVNKQRPQQEKKSKEEEDKEDEYPQCKFSFKPGAFVGFSFLGKDGEPRPDPESAFLPDTRHFPVLSIKAIPPSLLRADINSDHKGLVRGYFTSEHMSLLNTIRKSGQLMIHMPFHEYADDITNSRKALLQGIHVAVSTINVRALDILLKIDHFLYRGLGSYGAFPSRLFRIAAQAYLNIDSVHKEIADHTGIVSGDNTHTVALLSFCLLLSSSAESVPHDDPVVERFATRVGGAFGGWLQDFMRYLPGQIEKLAEDDTAGSDVVFIARSPNDFSLMGSSYLEEVLFTDYLFELPISWMYDELSGYGDYGIYL